MNGNLTAKTKKLLLSIRIISIFSFIFLICRLVFNFFYQYFRFDGFSPLGFYLTYGASLMSFLSVALFIFFIQKSDFSQSNRELIGICIASFAVSFLIPIHHLSSKAGLTVFYILFNAAAISSSLVFSYKIFKREQLKDQCVVTLIANISSAVFSFFVIYNFAAGYYGSVYALFVCIFSLLTIITFHVTVFLKFYNVNAFKNTSNPSYDTVDAPFTETAKLTSAAKTLIIYSIVVFSILCTLDFTSVSRIFQPLSFSVLFAAILLLLYIKGWRKKSYARLLLVFALAIFTLSSCTGIPFFRTEYKYYVYSFKIIYWAVFVIFAIHILGKKPLKNVSIAYITSATVSILLSGMGAPYIFDLYMPNADHLGLALLGALFNCVILIPIVIAIFLLCRPPKDEKKEDSAPTPVFNVVEDRSQLLEILPLDEIADDYDNSPAFPPT